jgi:hypothetical protein
MPFERAIPRKQPKGVRPSAELEALIRSIEETRVLNAEVAQLLCDLQVCVSRLHEIKGARVLKLPAKISR